MSLYHHYYNYIIIIAIENAADFAGDYYLGERRKFMYFRRILNLCMIDDF